MCSFRKTRVKYNSKARENYSLGASGILNFVKYGEKITREIEKFSLKVKNVHFLKKIVGKCTPLTQRGGGCSGD